MRSVRLIGAIVGIVVAAAVAFSLSGWEEKTAVSDQIVVTGIGIRQKNQGYELAIQAVESLKTAGSLSEQTENATAVYRTEGTSVAKALQAFLNEAGRSTYILHNRILALQLSDHKERSLFETLDYFMRNLEGRTLVDLVVCRGDPSDLLTVESGNDAIPAEYLSQLLQEGYDRGIAVNTHLLDAQRASSGMYDLAIPILRVTQNTPRLDGTALFKNGVLAGELSEKQTTGLLFAADDLKQCLYTVNEVTFRIEESRTAWEIVPTNRGYRYRFSVTGKACVLENAHKVDVQAEKGELWNALEQAVVTDTESALKTAYLTYETDPLGLARSTAKQEKIAQNEAKKRLLQSEYEVTVTLRFAQSGFIN